MIFVFRPEIVKKIIEADPEFYQQPGDTLLDSIARVSAAGKNGELLGFGARHMLTKPSHRVQILKGDKLVLYYFVSDPDIANATRFATERAKDFTRAFGWDDVSFRLTQAE